MRPDGETDVASRPEQLYSSRLPAYHRLDVRFTRRYRTARGDVRVFLELINLANRENVFAYDYEKKVADDGTRYLARDTESWFPAAAVDRDELGPGDPLFHLGISPFESEFSVLPGMPGRLPGSHFPGFFATFMVGSCPSDAPQP